MTRYRARHDSQYKAGTSARLRSMGCTVVSLGNALRNVTGGKVDLPGDQILAKVANSEETNPATAGWSLGDARKAASRIPGAPPLLIRSGSWAQLMADRASGRIIILQGDSDRFPNGTCSGVFDGDHAVAWHPDGVLGDPICPDWRSETADVLKAYATKLWGPTIRWGTFEQPVPVIDVGVPDMPGPNVVNLEPAPAGVAVKKAGVVAGFIRSDGVIVPAASDRYGIFGKAAMRSPVAGDVWVTRQADGWMGYILQREFDVQLDPPTPVPVPDCGPQVAAAIAADRARAHVELSGGEYRVVWL